MSSNMINGSANIANPDVLANAKDPGNICDPLRDTREKIEEQIIREINKPIYEFVSVINPKTEFARYTCLTRRDK